MVSYRTVYGYHTPHRHTVEGRRTVSERREERTPVLVVKTTVNLPITVVESMRQLAKARNTTLGKVISDAISLEQLVHKRTQQGARVVIEERGKKRTEVWLR